MFTVALTVFGSIFFAELPDKTSLATVHLAARYPWWRVWCGASLAFLVQTGLALWLGHFLGLLPRQWLHLGSGLLFLAFGVWQLRAAAAPQNASQRTETRTGGGARAAFLTVLLLELGDLTQILTAVWAAREPGRWLSVGLFAWGALIVANLLAAWFGGWLGGRLPVRWLQGGSALIFLGIGVWMLAPMG